MKKMLVAAAMIVSFNAHSVDLTVSPIYTAIEVLRSAVATAVTPYTVTSELSVSAAHREVAAVLQGQAADFLADGDVTFALTIEALAQDEELADLLHGRSLEEVAEKILLLSL